MPLGAIWEKGAIRPSFEKWRWRPTCAPAIGQVKAAYRVFAQRQAAANGDYDIPHSAITYLVAPGGALATRFVDALDGETIIGRLQNIL